MKFSVVGALLLGFCLTTPCPAQPIDLGLYLPTNRDKLADYFRDRLLRISYEVESRRTGLRETIQGTGFLISSGGYAMTARHVLEKSVDHENFDLISFSIEYRGADGRPVQARLDAEPVLQSKTSDITTFHVSTPFGDPINRYLCVEKSESWSVPRVAQLAAWHYFETVPSDWKLVEKLVTIEHRQGPQGFVDYLAIAEPFHDSMSGGAILVDGRVVAVVSSSLMQGDRPVPSGNYANLLRYGGDTAWRDRADACTSAVPDSVPFVTFKSQSAYMASTCEGTLAWVAPGAYWAFPKKGNYELRRRDLSACDSSLCGTCDSSKRIVHMVINHSVVPGRSGLCPTAPGISSRVESYFGAQIVPLFDKETRENESVSTWLYRNRKLLRRQPNGKFARTTVGPNAMSEPLPPLSYNEITLQKSRDGFSPPRCTGISKEACEDLLGVAYFDSQTRKIRQWHGWVRTKQNPVSTLGDRPTREMWAVPPNWIEQALQVKNLILAYKPASKAKSVKPLDFAFCVDTSWEGFHLRAFAPERGIDGVYVHVFLQ